MTIVIGRHRASLPDPRPTWGSSPVWRPRPAYSRER